MTTKSTQLVNTRKRLLAQIRAHQTPGTAVMCMDVDAELKQRIDSLRDELEERTTPAITGGRRALRHGMFQAALVAAQHNPSLRSFTDCLRKAGSPFPPTAHQAARRIGMSCVQYPQEHHGPNLPV